MRHSLPLVTPRSDVDAGPGDGFDAAMAALWAAVDAAIATHRPVCVNRGACCKFGAFGHRLYVTDVELRHFIEHQRSTGLREPAPDADACPYQAHGLCTARGHRPLGCRIFFCDPAAHEWQQPEYERWLSELKRIGERFGIGYRYREWLGALRDPAAPA